MYYVCVGLFVIDRKPGTLPRLPRPTGKNPVGPSTLLRLLRLPRPTGKNPVGSSTLLRLPRRAGKTSVGSNTLPRLPRLSRLPGQSTTSRQPGHATTSMGTSRTVVRIGPSSGRTSVNTFPALCLVCFGCLGRLAAASADSPLPSMMSSTHSVTTITINTTYLSFRTSGFLSFQVSEAPKSTNQRFKMSESQKLKLQDLIRFRNYSLEFVAPTSL
jgi:hypothetical protein